MKRLPGFTLLEMIVAMSLGVVAIAAAISAYGLFQKSIREYEENNSRAMSISQFAQILRFDIVGYDKMVFLNAASVFLCSEGDTVRYDFSENNVLRSQNHLIDTFYVHAALRQALFNEKAQTMRFGLVDELRISTIFDDQETTISFEKDYSAATLIENETDYMAE